MSALEDVYDDATLRAIDARTGEPSRPPAPGGGWRGGVTAGALVVGLVGGVRDALETDEPEPQVEVEARSRQRLEPVVVHLVPGDPAASVAIVRRWLL